MINKPGNHSDFQLPSLYELAKGAVFKLGVHGNEHTQRAYAPTGEHITLDNGMTIYIENREDSYSTNHFASVQLVVRSGYFEETEEERGIAHLVEHCVYQGTQEFDWKQIEEMQREFKCVSGADANATTSIERTTYLFNDVPIEKLFLCLKLLYQLSYCATFPMDRILNERDVVNDEMLLPEAWSYQSDVQFYRDIYPGAGLNLHMDHRLHDVIQSCDAEKLQQMLKAFYKKWYTPDRMGLIIIGDWTKKEGLDDCKPSLQDVIQSAHNCFSQSPATEHLGYQTFYEKIPTNYLIISDFKDPGILKTSFEIYAPDPVSEKYSQSHKDTLFRDYLRVIRLIITVCLEARMQEERKRHPSLLLKYDVKLFQGHNVRFKTMLAIEVSTPSNEEQLETVFRIVLQAIRSLAHHGITQQELDNKRKITKQYLQAEIDAESESHAEVAHRYGMYFKSDYPFIKQKASCLVRLVMLDRKSLLEEINKRLRQDLSCFVNPNLKNPPRIFIRRNFDAVSVEMKEKLANIYKEVATQEALLNSFEIKEPAVNWLPKGFNPIKPISSQQFSDLNCEVVKFDNGISAYLKPVRDRREHVYVLFSHPRGAKTVNTRQEHLAFNIGLAMFSSLGIGSLSYRMSQEAIENQSLTSSFLPCCEYDDDHWHLWVECFDAQGIEPACQLIYSKLTDTKPLESEDFHSSFESIKKTQIEVVRNRLQQPNQQFTIACLEQIYGKHELLDPWTLEELEHLTANECREALLRCLQDLSDARVVICGKFKTEPTLEIVKSYIGHLPSSQERREGKTSKLSPRTYQKHSMTLAIGRTPEKSLTCIYIPITSFTSFKEKYLTEKAVSTLEGYLSNVIRYEEQKIYSLECEMMETLGSYCLRIEFQSNVSIHDELSQRMLTLLEGLRETHAYPPAFVDSFKEGKLFDLKQRQTDINKTESWHVRMKEWIAKGIDPIEAVKEAQWDDDRSVEKDLGMINQLLSGLEHRVEMRLDPQVSSAPSTVT